MDLEESLHLIDDAVEIAGLVAVGCGVGVAVHRIALPDDLVPGCLHCLDDRRQNGADLVVSHAGDQREPSRDVVGIQGADVLHGLFRRGGRADLHAHRVGDHGDELNVRIFQTAGALSHPHLVSGEVVQRVFAVFVMAQAQHGALVIHHQGLVGSVNIRGVQLRIGDTTSIHELQAAVDLLGQRLVTSTRWGVGHELAVPLMQAVKVRGSGSGERAHQVHGCRSVGVSPHHAGRIVSTRFFSGLYTVDQVTAVAQQSVAFPVRGAGLGVLACDTSHLHHWGGGTVSKHHCHLQQRLHVSANVWFCVGLESLGAIAALQQEGLAQCHIAQLVAQPAYLLCHHDGWNGFQNLPHACGVISIPRGLLLCIARKYIAIKFLRHRWWQRWQIGQFI